MTDTETKLAIDIAADISTRPEFAKCESPLVLAIVQAAIAAHDSAGAQPVRPPDGLDIETIAATLDELGTTDGYDEEDLAWAKRQAGLLRTLANSTQQPSAYCLDCQRAGMRNCQHFDECSGATCVTCHRPLNTPARPTSAMHQQLLDTLGATNQSDAMRIIAEHHARELRAQPASVADGFVMVRREPTQAMVEAICKIKLARLEALRTGHEAGSGIVAAVQEEWEAALATQENPNG